MTASLPPTCLTDLESRLWSKVTSAIKRNDQDAATDAKSAIESQQREVAKQRESSGEHWSPKYFHVKNDEHRPMITLVDKYHGPSYRN